MSEHTPTPWIKTNGDLIRVMEPGTGVCICGVHKIGSKSGARDSEAIAIANAAFIVRACNAHDNYERTLNNARRLAGIVAEECSDNLAAAATALIEEIDAMKAATP